jgi:O-antigen ligase
MISSRTLMSRGLAALSAALILHTTLLTFSRGALVGLLAVAVVAFALMPKRPKHMAALAVTLLLAVQYTGPELAERYMTIFASEEERDGSAVSRMDLWRDCIKVVKEYPVFGVGPANWRIVAAQYGWPEGKSAHSVWMETAAELGLPGAAFLLLFFVLALVKLWPIARTQVTDANRYEVVLASGVVLAIVGFCVSGQFVSVPGLEVPYYITMLGAAMLKGSRTAPLPESAAAPVSHAAIRTAAAIRPVPVGGYLGTEAGPSGPTNRFFTR